MNTALMVLVLGVLFALIGILWSIAGYHESEVRRLTMELADARSAPPNCHGCMIVKSCRDQGEALRLAWATVDEMQRARRHGLALVSDRLTETRPS
jgi:hypothetical protein